MSQLPSFVYSFTAKPRTSRARSNEPLLPATVENRTNAGVRSPAPLEDVGPGDVGQRLVGLEVSVCAVAAGVHHPLGDPLVVEVEDLLPEVEVLQQRRARARRRAACSGRRRRGTLLRRQPTKDRSPPDGSRLPSRHRWRTGEGRHGGRAGRRPRRPFGLAAGLRGAAMALSIPRIRSRSPTATVTPSSRARASLQVGERLRRLFPGARDPNLPRRRGTSAETDPARELAATRTTARTRRVGVHRRS